MKYEYKSIPLSELPNLNEYGSQGWLLVCEIRSTDKPILILSRELKTTRTQKKAAETPELREFRASYPKKDGTTSDAFASKYAKAVSEFGHGAIMESLARYREFWKNSNLAAGRPEKNAQFVPLAVTWLNQKRYETVPDSVFVPETKKAMIEMDALTAHLPEKLRKKVVAKATQYLEDHKDKTLSATLISNIANSLR